MTTTQRYFAHIFGVLILVLAVVGCSSTVKAVNPTPAVTVIGAATHGLDISKVPDIIEPGRNVTLTEVRRSLVNGFQNAVGEGFTKRKSADVRLVFDAFSARIDEGRIGVIRVTHKARWLDRDGTMLARTAGTAIPINPLQTGAGHWRDTLEVMFVQIANSLEKAQDRRDAG